MDSNNGAASAATSAPKFKPTWEGWCNLAGAKWDLTPRRGWTFAKGKDGEDDWTEAFGVTRGGNRRASSTICPEYSLPLLPPHEDLSDGRRGLDEAWAWLRLLPGAEDSHKNEITITCKPGYSSNDEDDLGESFVAIRRHEGDGRIEVHAEAITCCPWLLRRLSNRLLAVQSWVQKLAPRWESGDE